MQQTRLNFDAAEQLRDNGCALALANAPADWESAVREAVSGMQGEFMVENVRASVESLGLFPKSHNAWGALTRALVSEGLIVATGEYRRTSSPRTHSHPACVWRKVNG